MPGQEMRGVGAPSPDPVTVHAPSSVLQDVDVAICATLGIQNLRHRSALMDLCAREVMPCGSVEAAFRTIAGNWRYCQLITGGGTSRENWRWRKPQLAIAPQNASPEVVLERALISSLERRGRIDWSNQVPIVSGVAGSSRERRRAIDLVHEVDPGHVELIELKVASDTPLYAAFEIIGYTCIWLLSREGLTRGPLLAATRLDAVVWAPVSFFAQYRLSSLREQLDLELRALGRKHGVDLSFRFETYPDELLRPTYTDDEVLALLDRRRSL